MGLEDVFRTGKLEVKKDSRTLKAAELLAGTAVDLPGEFDIDLDDVPQIVAHGNRMYRNNKWGCCVISGRAHQTLRFELLETGRIIPLTDEEVEDQYFRETGGRNRDDGLVLLESLKRWRNEGWTAGGRNLKIFVYASINKANREEIKTAIIMRMGIGIGLSLPDNATAEFASGREWVDVSRPRGGGGGHYVYVTGYNSDGLTCVTWAQKQHMSWRFFERYCDEAYAIVDHQQTLDPSLRGIANDFLDDL
ncbi:MAG: hypothetical protein L0Y70_29460 [Gemmataceae bacterium]|nr:hypothetical protein [Gemmataceae bacterium]